MPKRILDGEGMWGSTRLSNCPEWAIPWYAWLHPLADANGSFEVTNMRVVWCKVAAILPNFTLETLAEVIRIFHEHGLLLIWEQDGKRYGHWTGSDRPGRLPRPARRTARYGPLLAPPVPAPQLQEYQLRHQKRRTATAEASPVLDLVLDGDREGGKEGAPQTGAPAAQDKPRPSPFVFTGHHLEVTEKQDHILGMAFPWTDRIGEYAKADSWLEGNPGRRPKRTGAFLHNWFSRVPSPSNGQGRNRADDRTRRNLKSLGLLPRA